MTYEKALIYLGSLESFGIRLGLSNIRKCLKTLSNPQERFRTIHIAGTNGKGSVSAMISNVLSESGFKVGLYTSPHLLDVRERIRVDGRVISKRALGYLTEMILDAYPCRDLTYFEFLTVVAFVHFAGQKVDFAVLETGMGGRLDATNIVKKPLVSVITNIDREHTEYLGKTTRCIAREKAGIIREKGIVITGEEKDEAFGVIRKISKEKGANLFRLGKDMKVRTISSSPSVQRFDYRGIMGSYRDLRIRLCGKHQLKNAALALGISEALRLNHIRLAGCDVRRGLYITRWPGRMEFFYRRRGMGKARILLDGAHNPAAIRALKSALKDIRYGYRHLILVLGILGDKDVKSMVSEIVPMADRVIVVAPKVQRALPEENLARHVLRYTGSAESAESVGEGLRKATELSGERDLICVTGSLYTVGEARHVLEKSLPAA